MKNYLAIIVTILLLVVYPQLCNSQVEWVQKIDGWIDGQYQPYLFLGGNYYTKVSFADIDGDGDYDMFYGGGGTGSFRLFENVGTPYSPHFQLRDAVHPGIIRPLRGTFDADFADLDGDNDLDVIVMLDHMWGGGCRFENVGDNQNPIWQYPPYGEQRAIGINGTPSLLDFDGDGDFDIISGLHDNRIDLYENTDNPIPLYFHLVTDSLGNINIGSTFNMDVKDLDSDDDYDIVACVTGGVNKYYKNIGGPGYDSLEWVLVDSNFLGGQYNPDWLECPELVDIDADGDLDLFLSGAFAHLNFFENVGSPYDPIFEHRYDTTYFYNFPINVNDARFVDIDGDGDQDIAANTMLLRNHGVGPSNDPHWTTEIDFFPYYYKRCFCDIDGDIDYDMLVPTDTHLRLISNIGTSQIPEWDNGQVLIQDSHTHFLYIAVPVDIDADNDFDLIMCGPSVDLIFYENVGDAFNPDFEFITDDYLGFHKETPFDPVFADLDLDGDQDMLISYWWNWDLRSKLMYYENIGTPEEAVWDSVTDDYMGWFSSGLVAHAYLDLGDYDADGDFDVLMSFSQGMRLFLNQLDPTGINDDETGNNNVSDMVFSVKTFPNPFNQTVTFDLNVPVNSQITISIYNILGQQVDLIFVPFVQDSQYKFSWNAKNFPSGIYFYEVSVDNFKYAGKFVLMK